MLIEGETPATMAKSTGLGLIELPTVFEQLKPDVVLTVGDRFETMATTLAAAYMNIPIAHTMGGEVSGTIDESIRHAVTKFAHIHFPASRDAHERIVQLGERPEHVHLVGCPRIDLVADILAARQGTGSGPTSSTRASGAQFDLDEPFLLVSQHPVTTEYGEGEAQITATLEAVRSDAAAGDRAVAQRRRRLGGHRPRHPQVARARPRREHALLQEPADRRLHAADARTACLVGNSSSGIREGAFIGTPVVNIGIAPGGPRAGPAT